MKKQDKLKELFDTFSKDFKELLNEEEPIEEPLLWLDGSVIEFEDDIVNINGLWYDKNEIKALKTLPIFQKILDRMNKTN